MINLPRLVLLQLFFHSCFHENDTLLNFISLIYKRIRRKANKKSTASCRVPFAFGNTYSLLGIMTFLCYRLPDSMATYCCFIFLILSKSFRGFWKPSSLKCSIQHKLNLLKVTYDVPCNPSASFRTRSCRDKKNGRSNPTSWGPKWLPESVS